MTRTTIPAALVALAAIAAPAAGCGHGPAPDERAGADAAVSPLAPHGRLAALLPTVDGWERAAIESAEVGDPAPASHAATVYTRDAARVEMDITDTASQSEYLEATRKIAGTSFERTSENGYVRGATIGGAPAIESWNHVDRLGEITVVVADRFVVHAGGSGLEDLATLRAFVEHVAFDRLAALAPPTPR